MELERRSAAQSRVNDLCRLVGHPSPVEAGLLPSKPDNEHPTWLDLAHRKLDEAVLDVYDWPHDLGDQEILERLSALNLDRAKRQGQD